MQSRKKKAFTLVELLMVIAIIGILISMMFVGIHHVAKKARRNKCRAELNELVKAWKLYWVTYQKWPPSIGTGSDVPMTANVVRILQGDPVNPEDNPQRIKFLDLPHSGDYKDPYNTVYRMDFSDTYTEGVDFYETKVYFINRKRYYHDQKKPAKQP